ncbi:MAG: HlyD family efflux transporter periplasmic adaptor subunit [Allosphingosinicella sp.]
MLDRGVAPILPSRAGIVTAVVAREGKPVQAGDELIRIRSEEDLTRGNTAPQRVLDALREQDQRLERQSSLTISAAEAERSRLAAEIIGIEAELTSLDSQIAAQRRLVEVAANEFRDVAGIAGKGFISRRDLEGRETALLARRKELAQLEQAQAAKQADRTDARRMIAQAGAAAEAQVAGLQSNRAELAGRAAEAESSQGYRITSPLAGIVTAVTARIGQHAVQQQPLMMVMPSGARPQVELYVPSSAAGFLGVGQEVRLSVDAFPYQRFGTIQARIREVSSTAIPKVMPEGGAAPVYLVTAELSRPWVLAFGKKHPLLPGMTLSARIVTKKQSLLEWLFQPLFAVGRR